MTAYVLQLQHISLLHQERLGDLEEKIDELLQLQHRQQQMLQVAIATVPQPQPRATSSNVKLQPAVGAVARRGKVLD